MKKTIKVSKIPVLGLAVAIMAIALSLALTACEDLNDGEDDTTFNSVEAFNEWLAKQPNNTPETAYRVKLNVNDISGHKIGDWGWDYDNRNKWVYLDLSDSTMTNIGVEAFSWCWKLTGITIPDSVVSIGKKAFERCHDITSVTLGNSVISIGEEAFSFCISLTSITIPNSVTSIGSGAFSSCTSLTSVTIGSGVTSIGTSVFDNCKGLTGVIIPNSVKSIEDNAFRSCTGLTSVVIPNSVTSLNGFSLCTNLASVTIGNSVTSIGPSAFRGCTSLTSVTIPSSVNSIDKGAFGWESTHSIGLTSVTFDGTIPSSGFDGSYNDYNSPFPGDLRNKFYATDATNGTPGRYTRPNTSDSTWTLQS